MIGCTDRHQRADMPLSSTCRIYVHLRSALAIIVVFSSLGSNRWCAPVCTCLVHVSFSTEGQRFLKPLTTHLQLFPSSCACIVLYSPAPLHAQACDRQRQAISRMFYTLTANCRSDLLNIFWRSARYSELACDSTIGSTACRQLAVYAHVFSETYPFCN